MTQWTKEAGNFLVKISPSHSYKIWAPSEHIAITIFIFTDLEFKTKFMLGLPKLIHV